MFAKSQRATKRAATRCVTRFAATPRRSRGNLHSAKPVADANKIVKRGTKRVLLRVRTSCAAATFPLRNRVNSSCAKFEREYRSSDVGRP